MSQFSNDISFLVDPVISFEEMGQLSPFEPFTDIVCEFLSDLSKDLLANKDNRRYSEIIAFGYFCRKGNLEQLRRRYTGRLSNRLGKGLAFHIAPSNVPVNFAFSLVAGLLSGNPCIVRVSSKDFEQTNIISRSIQDVLRNQRYAELRPFVSIIKYPRKKEINDFFSRICRVRIIWGGDDTIQKVRESALSPTGIDVLFADRRSLSIISTENYNEYTDHLGLANRFFNDVFLFDQNACTSPRLVYWLGDDTSSIRAKKTFWELLHEIALQRYEIQDKVAVDKMVNAYGAAIDLDDVRIAPQDDNLITRIEMTEPTHSWRDHICSSGFFYEYTSNSLDDVVKLVDERVQTLSYFGIEKTVLTEFVVDRRIRGIDRIVEIGRTMDFDLVWDGIDLITTMSREIN